MPGQTDCTEASPEVGRSPAGRSVAWPCWCVLLLIGCRAASDSGEIPTKARPATALRARSQSAINPNPIGDLPWTGFSDERLWSAHTDWEPALAVHPVLDHVYQMVTRYDAGGSSAPNPAVLVRASLDGASTWGSDHYLEFLPTNQNDPQIECSSAGTLFATWIDGFVPGVLLAKSQDGGASWSTPLSAIAGGPPPTWSDKPILVTSDDGQVLHLAFNASDAYVVSSNDAGASLSAPHRTSNDSRYWFHTAGTISENGEVYFAATDYSQSYGGDSHVNVIRSHDGGQSWQTVRVDTSSEMPDCSWSPGCPTGYLGPGAGIAADPAGLLALAYNAGNQSGEPQRLYVRTSADGVAWSARQLLSTAPTGTNHAFAAVAAGPTPGDFRVVWQDDRAGTGQWNTWYRRTKDGGQSWSAEVRLSNLGHGATYKSARGYAFPYGDYLEIEVDAQGTNHVIWGEGESWIGSGGVWYTRGQVR